MTDVVRPPTRRALVAVGLAVSVNSCSMVGFRADDPGVAYATAEERALLELPPDLSGNIRQPLLRLPEAGKSKIARSTLLPDPDSVRLVRDGGLRWLEFSANARELWPELKQFLGRSGFALARDEPLVGLLETEWQNEVAGGEREAGSLFAGFFSGPDTDTREKFRLRVERVDGDSDAVRLFVTQRRIEMIRSTSGGLLTDERRFVKRAPDGERETELMLQLLVYLGVREQRARDVLTADEAQQLTARAYLEEVNGENTIAVADTYHRVWVQVGELLEDIGLDVERVLKSESRYEVLYSGLPPQAVTARAETESDQPPENQGFFGGLFDDDEEIEQFYQVYVLEEPGSTRVSIADIAGDTPVPELKEQILQRLYENLR